MSTERQYKKAIQEFKLLKFPKQEEETIETQEKTITSVLKFVEQDVKDIADVLVVALSHDNAVYTLSSGLDEAQTVLLLERAKIRFIENAERKK